MAVIGIAPLTNIGQNAVQADRVAQERRRREPPYQLIRPGGVTGDV
jgi:hypothetical protein